MVGCSLATLGLIRFTRGVSLAHLTEPQRKPFGLYCIRRIIMGIRDMTTPDFQPQLIPAARHCSRHCFRSSARFTSPLCRMILTLGIGLLPYPPIRHVYAASRTGAFDPNSPECVYTALFDFGATDAATDATRQRQLPFLFPRTEESRKLPQEWSLRRCNTLRGNWCVGSWRAA